VKTYHYVRPNGLPSAGTISLRSSDGKLYGPWQATGSPSSDGLANAVWTASIDVELPAGIYTVIDSDPSTWSSNAASGGEGMFWISGLAPSGCGPGATATSGCEPAIVAGPVVLYTTGNNGWVTLGPTAPTGFTVASGPVRISEVKTYHYVRPNGLPSAGTISLRSSDGKLYGPWQATGSPSSVKRFETRVQLMI
jgi:hypothetical protein